MTTHRNPSRQCATRSISMPVELMEQVMQVIAKEPDLTFSQHVRRLLRRDLEQGKKEVAA